jgi:hydrogenase 3 maturation protease
MVDLRTHLRQRLHGRVCLVGLGNPELGDDGLGVHLATQLAAAGCPDVVSGGSFPERALASLDLGRYDHLVFLDAVELGAEPGSAVFLSRREVCATFPQVSTHKLSVGLLASVVEQRGRTKAWLLGVQPQSLSSSATLSPTVQVTLDALTTVLQEVLAPASPAEQAALAAAGSPGGQLRGKSEGRPLREVAS